jgi:hypothetical protein
MADPLVSTAGASYDRSSIVRECPGDEARMVPNHALRSAIHEMSEQADREQPLLLGETLERKAVRCRALQASRVELAASLEVSQAKLDAVVAALGSLTPTQSDRSPVHQATAASMDRSRSSPPRRALSPMKPSPGSCDVGGGDLHWLVRAHRALLIAELDVPWEGSVVSEAVEDELEEVVDALGSRRKVALGQWTADRGRRTRAQGPKSPRRLNLRALLAVVVGRGGH